jgi:hypothetical protein
MFHFTLSAFLRFSLLVSFAFFDLFKSAYAQSTFVKTYSGPVGEYGISVVKTFDGGYAFCGGSYTSNLVSSDIRIMIAKTDSSGNLLWMKRYSTNQLNYVSKLVQTADSGFVISGTSQPYNSNYQQDAFVLKVNSQGDSLWGKTIGSPGTSSEYANNLMVTRTGSLVTVGYNAPAVINYLYMTKTKADGSDTFGKSLMNNWIGGVGYGVTESLDGNYLFSGVHAVNPSRYHVLIKTDTAGNEIWAKRWLRQGNKGAIPNCLVQLADSTILIGSTINYDPNNNLSDTWIARCNFMGDTIKTWTIPNCRISSIFQNADGGFTICGQTPGFNSVGRFFRVAADGQTTLWEKTYSFFQPMELKEAIKLENKGFLLVGSSLSDLGERKALLIKTDSLGNTDEPTAILQRNTPSDFNLHPNPSNGHLFLEWGNKKAETIRIFNMMGKEVFQKQADADYKMELSLNSLPKGVYRIQISGKDFSASRLVILK